jgi:hypothetical protein
VTELERQISKRRIDVEFKKLCPEDRLILAADIFREYG